MSGNVETVPNIPMYVYPVHTVLCRSGASSSKGLCSIIPDADYCRPLITNELPNFRLVYIMA